MTAGCEDGRRSGVGAGDVDEKIAFLKRPDSYPEKTSVVDVKQTHMSWVFLTDRYAYKLKKPLRTASYDYSTPGRRRRNGEREIELNRRLAPDVYLGLVPLSRTADGRLVLEREENTIDWLVRMVRLPEALTLESQIDRADADRAPIEPAARLLADFYAAVMPDGMNERAYSDRFRADLETLREDLPRSRYGLPADLVGACIADQQRFLDRNVRLLEERAPRVIEGHGDLRPEHIYLGPRPVVLDCLEFRRDLRLLDPADELAFLAMECERLGDRRPGDIFLSIYRRHTGDDPPGPLVAFYNAFRALVRAQLAVWHLNDPDQDRHKWIGRADDYLRLARGYARTFLVTPR